MATIEVLLPQWGMGMSEGTITTWLKSVGDRVTEDEPLAEVEAARRQLHAQSERANAAEALPERHRTRIPSAVPSRRKRRGDCAPAGTVARDGLGPSRHRR